MNMLSTLNLRAMVTPENGEPMTTSYAVAEAFGKLHKNVIRDIERLACSDKFAKLNFELCFENSKLQNGKPLKFYRMTKDGWMFLVMGYTGKVAGQIKEAFIDAFNWMAEQLTQSFQAKMSRYNQISLAYQTQKEFVSGCARGMRNWQDDAPVYMAELEKLELELQPCLDFTQAR